MSDIAITALIFNAAMLLAVAQVFDIAAPRRRFDWLARWPWGVGIVLGGIGIGLMMAPLTLLPGVIFDARSVLLAITGLFFGVIPAVLAMAMTAAYRLSLGGAGVWPGVALILSSGLIGLAWRHWRRPALAAMGWRELYVLGLLVHLVMLGWMLTLSLEVAQRMALPVMILHPLLTVVLGLLLSARLARRDADRALQESEARYHSLFDNSHTVMLLIDPADGAIVAANPAAAAYYGWTAEQLQGMRISQINTLTSAEVQAEMQCARDRQRNYFEFKHRRADGSVSEVEVFTGPIKVADKQLLYSIVHDVSERRTAEAALRDSEAKRASEQAAALEEQRQSRLAALNLMEDAVAARNRAEVTLVALQESEALFRATFDQAAMGLARVAPDGSWLDVNQKLCDIVGYTREELLATNFQAITHPDDLNADLEFVHQLLAGERQNYSMEKRYFRKSGEIVWINLTLNLVRNATGVPLYFISVVEDINQRKQTEGQLRKLALAVDQSPEIIVIVNLQAEIEYVNETFVTLTGYSRAEVLGQNPRILKSGKTPAATYVAMWAALTQGQPWKGEFINRRKDGGEYVE
ncbi:MAG: PAS domain S-box protein, partial [Rhodocyclaceae bacterium]|nr:PAS domain S-box protein [Rhodocyclaceae bacterium]